MATKVETKRIQLVGNPNLRADQTTAGFVSIDMLFKNCMVMRDQNPAGGEGRLYLQRRPGLKSESPNVTSNHCTNFAFTNAGIMTADTDGDVYKATTYVGNADNSADCQWITSGYYDASLTNMALFLMRTGGVGYIYYHADNVTLGTVTVTGDLSTGSPTISNVAGTDWTTNVRVGALLSGTGIPAETRVKAIDTSANTITMGSDSDTEVNATATNTGVTVTYDHLCKVMDSTIQSKNVRGIQFMDGYIFALTTENLIYHSGYNDPQTWGSFDFIPAIRTHGSPSALLNIKGQLAVVKSGSIEFFQNVGNPTGSVLKRTDQMYNIGGGTSGTAAGTGVFQHENYVAMLTAEYGVRLWDTDKGSIEEITTPFIERYLSQLRYASGTGPLEIRMFSWRGKPYIYVFNQQWNWTSAWAMVYDIKEKFWWQFQSDSFFPIPTSDPSDAQVYWMSYSGSTPSGSYYSWDTDDELLQWADQSSTAIDSSIRTSRTDFGTRQWKRFRRFSLIGDVEASASTFTLTWTDDDYNNYSNSRSLDLTSADPTTTELGALRRPAFNLSNDAASAPFRLEAIEVEYEVLGR